MYNLPNEAEEEGSNYIHRNEYNNYIFYLC